MANTRSRGLDCGVASREPWSGVDWGLLAFGVALACMRLPLLLMRVAFAFVFSAFLIEEGLLAWGFLALVGPFELGVSILPLFFSRCAPQVAPRMSPGWRRSACVLGLVYESGWLLISGGPGTLWWWGTLTWIGLAISLAWIGWLRERELAR